jgi:hypothetical protein
MNILLADSVKASNTMFTFDLTEKLMLLLGIGGGVYTAVYAIWVSRKNSSGVSKSVPQNISKNKDSQS